MNVDLSEAKWFKSTRSGGAKEYVEIAHVDGGAAGIRDAKNPTGPPLSSASAVWNAFTTRLSSGVFGRA